MSTVESIQAEGGDFTSPQAWYDAHAGDITGDANAPYIGEMAAESFPGVDMSGSTTDADHYFHLRAQAGAEFTGDCTAGCAAINAFCGTGTNAIYISDSYTRVEHILIRDLAGDISDVRVVQVASPATYVLLDTVGIYNVNTAGILSEVLIGIDLPTPTGTTVRNCVIGKVSIENTNEQNVAAVAIDAVATAGYAHIYNNAIHNITATAVGRATASIIGIHVVGAADKGYVIDNIIGTLTSENVGAIDAAFADVQYNATTDTTGGTNSQDNITPADEFVDTTPATLDLHMKAGGQCEDNGLDLITGGYTNAPTEDCDNETRPNPGTWSIGIDHHVAGAALGAWETPYAIGAYEAGAWR